MFDLNSVFEKKKKKKIAYLAILRTINSLERVWNLCKTKEEEKNKTKHRIECSWWPCCVMWRLFSAIFDSVGMFCVRWAPRRRDAAENVYEYKYNL